MTPTPDPTLAARLARLRGGEHEAEADGYYDGSDLDQACGDAYRSGQLITLADHTAAVAKAVEASVNAENEACAKMLDNEADDYEADASRFRGGTDPHHYRMDLATTARKYAAAIRSRGAVM